MDAFDREVVANLVWVNLRRMLADKWDLQEVVDYGFDLDQDVVEDISKTLEVWVPAAR